MALPHLKSAHQTVDVLLVGGGIMSATLATILAQLDSSLNILMVEKLHDVALESSDGWNNAGTGHAGYCELNYTPEQADGSVAIKRALEINAAFESSLQFWSYLVEQNTLPAPQNFIRQVPHESAVWGEADVKFLRKRHAALSQHHLFKDMEYSEDASIIRQWMPLMMQSRDHSQPIAATRVKYGTDVDFGALTRSLIAALKTHPAFTLKLNSSVKTLKKSQDGSWKVQISNSTTKTTEKLNARFVFLGAGGGALHLLQKSGIAEGKGYGGFPVSGQWLVCQKPEVIAQHQAKVYGKAPIGAPPMSVPHLDTRYIDGKPALLFGPYAGFSSRFLKQGSLLDLSASVKPNNIKPMLAVGVQHTDLTKYLIGQVFQTHTQRMAALQQFYPEAKAEDWKLANAGQRVQIIKKCDQKTGKLEFGTEIVTAQDGSIAALLGASPGASTSVQAMLEVVERCFATQMRTPAWHNKMKAMLPSYGESLIENAALLKQVRERTLTTLALNN